MGFQKIVFLEVQDKHFTGNGRSKCSFKYYDRNTNDIIHVSRHVPISFLVKCQTQRVRGKTSLVMAMLQYIVDGDSKEDAATYKCK